MQRRSFLTGLAALAFPSISFSKTVFPKRLELDSKISKWSIYANSEYGCCAISSCAQAICIWTSMHGKPYVVPDKYIIDLWCNFTGYKKDDLKHKGAGTYLETVLESWTQGWDIGLLRKSFLIDYCQISFSDPETIKMVVDMYGGCLVSFLCPAYFLQSQEHNWCEFSTREKTNGHTTFLVGYDENFKNCDGSRGAAKIISWGEHHWVSWNFLKKYGQDAYALLSQEWTLGGFSPNKISRQKLQNILKITESYEQ